MIGDFAVPAYPAEGAIGSRSPGLLRTRPHQGDGTLTDTAVLCALTIASHMLMRVAAIVKTLRYPGTPWPRDPRNPNVVLAARRPIAALDHTGSGQALICSTILLRSRFRRYHLPHLQDDDAERNARQISVSRAYSQASDTT